MIPQKFFILKIGFKEKFTNLTSESSLSESCLPNAFIASIIVSTGPDYISASLRNNEPSLVFEIASSD